MTKMPLAEHNNVVKAFPSDRTDQSVARSRSAFQVHIRPKADLILMP
jgi:hypothetical protein